LSLVIVPLVFVPGLVGAALWGTHGFVVSTAVALAVYGLLSYVVLFRVAGHARQSGRPIPGHLSG
jgi:hypothetical protein